jgi:hypothetical protein
LALTELVSEPLCRNASGTSTFTSPSGAQLVLAVVIPELCYGPNLKQVYQGAAVTELKIVGDTGRFASLTGSGYEGG